MKQIGFIGAGKMGAGVVKNLIKAGYPVTVFQHRNPEPLAALAEAGAEVTANLEDCIANCAVVFTCLPSMDSWDAVFRQILQHGTHGSLVIDLTSAQPALTRRMADELQSKGIALVDAPMLKGPAAAEAATIQLLVGGEADAVSRASGLLDVISEAQYHTGGPGSGHALKLINNAVTLTNSAIVYETFALAARLGIDIDLAHTAMKASAAGSKRLDAIAPILKSGKHPPSFDIATALKDLDLYCDLVRDAGAMSLAGSASRQLYQMGKMAGLGQKPVTQLGEMLFDLYSGRADDIGHPEAIRNAQEKK